MRPRLHSVDVSLTLQSSSCSLGFALSSTSHISSIYLQTLVLARAQYPKLTVPADAIDSDTFARTRCSFGTNAFPIDRVYALANNPIFAVLRTSHVPNLASPVITSTDQSIFGIWISCQSHNSILVASQSHCRYCRCRVSDVDQPDISPY